MTDQHLALEMSTLPNGLSTVANESSLANSPVSRSRTVSEVIQDGIDDTRNDVHDGLLSEDDNSTKHISILSNNEKQPIDEVIHRRKQYDTGTIMLNGIETKLPDVNLYQQKKTLAQGMLDLALLSANANQLKYVLNSSKTYLYFLSITLIAISITFQIAVGVGLILNSKCNIKDGRMQCKANKINNYTTIGIFIITVVNVLIPSFGVNPP